MSWVSYLGRVFVYYYVVGPLSRSCICVLLCRGSLISVVYLCIIMSWVPYLGRVFVYYYVVGPLSRSCICVLLCRGSLISVVY